MPITTELANKLKQLTTKQQAIAWALAEGKTNKAAAEAADATPEWVSNLMRLPKYNKFQLIVAELTVNTGLALASERMRLAKQALEQFKSLSGYLKTDKDSLDWAKYLGTLTEGPEGTQKIELEFKEPKSMQELMEELDG